MGWSARHDAGWDVTPVKRRLRGLRTRWERRSRSGGAGAAPELVPRLLTRLARHGPGPTAVIRAAPSGRDPAELLPGGAFNVVLVRGVVDMPGLDSVVVAREAVGVALSVEHPLAERLAVAPGDLSGVPLISFARSSDPNEFDRLYAPLLSAGLSVPPTGLMQSVRGACIGDRCRVL